MKRLTLLLFLLLSLPVCAQFHVATAATIGSGGGAYQNPVARLTVEPSYSFGGDGLVFQRANTSAEDCAKEGGRYLPNGVHGTDANGNPKSWPACLSRGQQWTVRGQGFLIPTGKADTEDGYTAGVRVEVLKKVHPVWSVGAGESYSYTSTSSYDKSATRPYLVAEWRIEDCCDGLLATMTTRFFLPYGDPRNGLLGPEVTLDIPWRRHPWLAARTVMTLYSVYQTDAPQLGRSTHAAIAGGPLFLW